MQMIIVKTFLLALFPILFTLLLSRSNVHAAFKHTFENLGQPVRAGGLSIAFVTQDAQGHYVGWGAVRSAEEQSLLGVRVDTGELIWVDLLKFGNSHIQMIKAGDHNIYAYTGVPGRFVKYDVKKNELVDLGVPAEDCTYWLGSATGPDGKFYVGSYPSTHLVCCNPATGQVEDLGKMAVDDRECYIIHPAVSDDNVVYCPVGLHHMELWAFDVAKRAKKQILPEELTKAQGAPKVWVGTDGRVYGQAGNAQFLCQSDGVELGKSMQAKRMLKDNVAGGKIVGPVNENGELVLTDTKTKEKVFVQTEFSGVASNIYCIGCLRDGKLYGGCITPANIFCFDTKSGELKDQGRMTGGRIQVYDILNHPKGLFMSSYTGASLDFYNPACQLEAGKNPRHIASLHQNYMQERLVQLVLGPDEMIYTGGIPVKGHLGGALVRINPDDFTVKVWRNLIYNQSIEYLAPVPETGELFCTSTIRGGSSAIPTEKEAFVFLWDTKQEKINFQAQPVPETTSGPILLRIRPTQVHL